MRRLLIKIFAVETALLGWLAYWLFLVYANNPGVTDQLVGNLQRFPQLSFTTVDISVMVIIAVLSIILAFKFHRGLRPGIRLERAVQMLENLMKRNLVLEAQLAELKVEKAQATPPPIPIQTSHPESKSGSWEKAFRTPLEAGPPMTSSNNVSQDIPFDGQTGIPPPRIEMKTQNFRPPMIIQERPLEKTITVLTPKPSEKTLEASSTSSNWEDSPKFTGETKRILTPSPPPRKTPPISESGGLKQPYIPAPAAKSIPASVIVGGMNPPSLHFRPFSHPPTTPQASPRNVTPSPGRLPQSQTGSDAQPRIKIEASSVSSEKPDPETAAPETTDDPSNANIEDKKDLEESPSPEEKETRKPAQKKKFPYEEEEE